MNRTRGYYWVQHKHSDVWIIAYWSGDNFYVMFENVGFKEECFNVINEKRIVREI